MAFRPISLKTTAKRFDRNIDNKDSLIKIANEVYMAADTYLKENERYNAAAQIILGGWTEAIYIAIDMAKSTRDFDIIEDWPNRNIPWPISWKCSRIMKAIR